jgi:hypothetical protein
MKEELLTIFSYRCYKDYGIWDIISPDICHGEIIQFRNKLFFYRTRMCGLQKFFSRKSGTLTFQKRYICRPGMLALFESCMANVHFPIWI